MTEEPTPKYVISTETFESVGDVIDQLEAFFIKGGWKPGTRVFRVVEVLLPSVEQKPVVTLRHDKLYDLPEDFFGRKEKARARKNK